MPDTATENHPNQLVQRGKERMNSMSASEATLSGKTALVTGGTRNLGRGIAERLARSGALVAINYASNSVAARETLDAIAAEGGQAFLLEQKLGADGSAEAMAAALSVELEQRTGSRELDILVNNAGGGGYADIHSMTGDLFDDIVTLNMRVPFFVTKALLPNLRHGGCVINISSAASRLALPDAIVYGMCKAAVDLFTKTMAKELGGRGITVNAVSPGFNETEATAGDLKDPERKKAIEDLTLLGRFGLPADIADCVYAVASDDMRWVTGQIIEASGGFNF